MLLQACGLLHKNAPRLHEHDSALPLKLKSLSPLWYLKIDKIMKKMTF